MEKKNQITGEQEVCISCGICCDGTLYSKANLYPGEKGTLPEKMEQSYFRTEKGEFFKLPCSYFSGKCTIYHMKKAKVCSGFKCKLLMKFSKEKVSKDDALKIIQNVKLYRKEIQSIAYSEFNIPKNTPFKNLQEKIAKIKESMPDNNKNPQLEMLIAKCLILEVLLTRHFLSNEDFDKMIINPVQEENELG